MPFGLSCWNCSDGARDTTTTARQRQTRNTSLPWWNWIRTRSAKYLRYWQTSETLTRNFGRNVRSFGVRASWIICRTYIQSGRYQHPKGHLQNRQRRKARPLRPRQRKSRRRTNRRNEAGRRGQGRSRKSPGRCRKSSKHYLIDFMRCTRKR